MKNIILLIALFFSVSISRAQFETGKKVIGGQLGFSYYDNSLDNPSSGNQQRSSYLNGTASFSRFKSPTLLNGFGFTYSYSYNHYNIGNTPSDEIDYRHSFGAFVSSTKLHPLVRKLYLGLTGTAVVGYGFGKNKYVSTGDYSNTNNYNISVSGGLGLFYQLHRRLLLDANLSNLLSLSYYHSNNTNYSGVNVYKGSSNNLGFSTGLNGFGLYNISVGVRYIMK